MRDVGRAIRLLHGAVGGGDHSDELTAIADKLDPPESEPGEPEPEDGNAAPAAPEPTETTETMTSPESIEHPEPEPGATS
jgi:hypothetical protein